MNRFSKTFLGCALLIFSLLLWGCAKEQAQKPEQLTIISSCYPIHLHLLNITKDVKGVKVKLLATPQTDSLQDHRLNAENITDLKQADILVVNGLGLEGFLDEAEKVNKKDLKIINASANDLINPITEKEETNPHVWLSVTYAIAQAKTINSELCQIDPAHEKEYRKNTLDYVLRLEKLRDDMHKKLDDLPLKNIATSNNLFPYLFKEFKLIPQKSNTDNPELDPIINSAGREQDADAYIKAMEKNTSLLENETN